MRAEATHLAISLNASCSPPCEADHASSILEEAWTRTPNQLTIRKRLRIQRRVTTPLFIDIEVVTGLRPTPAPLALDPEVEELIARINSRNNQLRQDALTIAQQWVDDGNDLIAIKQQVGHGPFGDIVIRQFPFSLRSAEHRMRIARAIAAGTIKIETVANLGLTAAIASLSTIDPLARQQRKLRGAFRTFVSKNGTQSSSKNVTMLSRRSSNSMAHSRLWSGRNPISLVRPWWLNGTRWWNGSGPGAAMSGN